MMRQKNSLQILKDVRARDGHAKFLQQRFQVFFRALLTAEANLIMKWIASPMEF